MVKKAIDLSHSFDLAGIWWLPSDENDRASGTLKFTPTGGLVLELNGSLHGVSVTGSFLSVTAGLIHGIAANGTQCSLLGAFRTNHSFAPGYATSTFDVNCAIIGALTMAIDSLQCESISVRYTHLEEWVGTRPLSSKRGYTKKLPTSLSLTYTKPKAVKFSVPAIDSTVTLEASCHEKRELHSSSLCHTERIRLRPKSREPLRWFMEQAHHLRNLLSLLTMEPVFLTSFRIRLGRKKAGGSMNRMLPIDAELIFAQRYFIEETSSQWIDIPFPYPALGRSMGGILNIWFKDHELMKPVQDLFFAGFHNPHLSTEFQFLSLTQGLESLHRRLHRGRYITKKKYEQCRQALTSAIPLGIPTAHRQSLKNRIKYGNEYSLRKRLTLMGNKLPKATRGLIATDFKSFLGKVVDTRNHLTHYDPKPAQHPMSEEEMILATFSLRVFLASCFLERIGLVPSVIAKVIAGNRRFQKPEMLTL